MNRLSRFTAVIIMSAALLFDSADALGQSRSVRIIKEGAVMRAAPDENSPVIKNLQLGTSVFPMDREEGWVKIQLRPNETDKDFGYVSSAFFEFEEPEIRQPGEPEEYALNDASERKRTRISVGATYGKAWSITADAVGEFEDTEFKNVSAKSASLMVVFPSNFALEFRVGQLAMVLSELDEEFGTLNQNPVELLFKYQRLPQKALGVGTHADVGLGFNMTNFQKGPFIKDIELLTGAIYRIETKQSFFADLGIGLDIFLGRFMSINLEGRVYFGNISSTWTASGPDSTNSDKYKFYISNGQALIGLRFWI